MMKDAKSCLLAAALGIGISGGVGAEPMAGHTEGVAFAAPFRSSVMLSNGRQLSYLHWANPSKPALLLLHGKQGYASSFSDLANRYADRFDLYAIDMRGRGFSDWAPDGDYTVESTEKDIEDFVGAVGLKRFGLYGHSFGAVMSLNYAAHHTTSITFLIMEDAGPITLPDGSRPVLNERQQAPAGALTPEPARLVFNSWDEVAKACKSYCSPAQYDSAFVRRFDGSLVERNDIHGLWASRRGDGFNNQWPLVSKITMPALYLRAQYGLMPLQIAKEVGRMNAYFTVVSVAGASHSMRWSKAEPTYQAITAFFDRSDVMQRIGN